jgi:hypothetical protein
MCCMPQRPLKLSNAKSTTLTNGKKKVVVAYDTYDDAWTAICSIGGKRVPEQDKTCDTEAECRAYANKWLGEK